MPAVGFDILDCCQILLAGICVKVEISQNGPVNFLPLSLQVHCLVNMMIHDLILRKDLIGREHEMVEVPFCFTAVSSRYRNKQ